MCNKKMDNDNEIFGRHLGCDGCASIGAASGENRKKRTQNFLFAGHHGDSQVDRFLAIRYGGSKSVFHLSLFFSLSRMNGGGS